MESMKLYMLNSLALVITFTNVENILKLTLLVLSIIYTVVKIYESFNKNTNENTDKKTS
jgi:dipeptide/tripeptide permease